MVGRFVWGAMYLARTIEYAVQAGWSSAAPFIGLLSLAGLGATESGVNCSVIGVIAIASAFVSVAPELAGAVADIRSVRMWRGAMDLGFSWPRCQASHSARI